MDRCCEQVGLLCSARPHSPPREEGWLRHQENFGEAHLSAADGVVAHKSRFRGERPPRPLR